MAVDEVLFRGGEEGGRPLLRVYRWERPCVSIGYFQKASEAGEVPGSDGRGRAVVRRWTGGGRVAHGSDFTYSLIVPAGFLGSRLAPRESYRWIHESLCAALGEAGHAAEVVEVQRNQAPGSGDAGPGDCFRRPVAWDVMAGGRKLAGAAQRRTRHGLLHQGSVQGLALDPGFGEVLAQALSGIVFPRRDALHGLEGKIADLVRVRYGSPEWLHRLEGC